jgi:hypothetical protein
VNIKADISVVAPRTFFGCQNLTNVTLPMKIREIGDNAFFGCANLEILQIPASVTNIGDYAFSSSGLVSVSLPDSLASMGFLAFSDCARLTEISIPQGLAFIRAATFENSPKLQAINVDPQNPSYSSLDGVLFNKDQTVLSLYPAGKAGSYSVPQTVAVVGEFAFSACSGVTSLNIPKSVKVIGYAGFVACTNLSTIYFEGNAPSEGGGLFESAPFPTVYRLPKTSGWNATFGGAPVILWNPEFQTPISNEGRFEFTITGPAEAAIIVEVSAELDPPAWLPISTNIFGVTGTARFSDPKSTPRRFYRFRSP